LDLTSKNSLYVASPGGGKMMKHRYTYADLDDAGLKKVRAMEEQLASVVIVMERLIPAASLSEEQLKQIQSLEKELGVVLVAYTEK
jgi:hypothetical protein